MRGNIPNVASNAEGQPHKISDESDLKIPGRCNLAATIAWDLLLVSRRIAVQT
jgi:hypothetical protein